MMDFHLSEKRHTELRGKGYFLVTDVTFEAVENLMGWILNNRPDKKELTIVINSSGGSPGAVCYFSSFLRTLEKDAQITGVAFGQCGSAAFALLQCCHARVGVQDCGFFVHRLRHDTSLTGLTNIDRDIKPRISSSLGVEDTLVRLTCKRSKLSKKQWYKLADEGERIPGHAIMADRALKLGFIDKIVNSFPLF
jgi:ATP-dependent protease ClpP protease subunit